MAEARQKVKDLENEATAIVLKLNDLQNKFYSEDDGFKREECSGRFRRAITNRTE